MLTNQKDPCFRDNVQNSPRYVARSLSSSNFLIPILKDLAGIIFEEAMQELLMDEWLKQFRYWSLESLVMYMYSTPSPSLPSAPPSPPSLPYLLLRFLGKVLSQYISLCVNNGRGDKTIFSSGFDYKRWKKTYSKSKVKIPSSPTGLHTSSTFPPLSLVSPFSPLTRAPWILGALRGSHH